MTPHDYGNHRAADQPTHVRHHDGGVGRWDRVGHDIPIHPAILRQRGQINARAYEEAKARRTTDINHRDRCSIWRGGSCDCWPEGTA